MTQNQSILKLLQDANGEWVDLPTLSRESGSLNISKRISELRRGEYLSTPYQIENETKQDGQRKVSRYRLVRVNK